MLKFFDDIHSCSDQIKKLFSFKISWVDLVEDDASNLCHNLIETEQNMQFPGKARSSQKFHILFSKRRNEIKCLWKFFISEAFRNMAKLFRTLRTHWKKSIFFSGVAALGLHYGKKKFDEKIMMKNFRYWSNFNNL